FFFFFSSRRRHTRSKRDWSSDVCSSDLIVFRARQAEPSWVLLMEARHLASKPRWKASRSSATIWPAEQLTSLRAPNLSGSSALRSEERRVGKECRSRGSGYADRKDRKTD